MPHGRASSALCCRSTRQPAPPCWSPSSCEPMAAPLRTRQRDPQCAQGAEPPAMTTMHENASRTTGGHFMRADITSRGRVAGYSVWVEKKPRQERLIRRFRITRQQSWEVALYLANTLWMIGMPVSAELFLPGGAGKIIHRGAKTAAAQRKTFFPRAHANARIVKKFAPEDRRRGGH